MKYLEMRMSQPDKTEWYLMQLTAYMLGMFSGKVPNLDAFKMGFEWKTEGEKPKGGMSKNEYTKRAWIGMVGGVVRNADESGNISETVTVTSSKKP